MSREGADAEILWDSWGVPHIFAEDDASLFRAFGFAQARNHGDLVLRLYGQARGRAAEYWGEEYLASDRLTRTMGIPGRAAAWLQLQSPDFRRYLEAFAAGMNEFAARHPDRLAADVRPVLPVSAGDVLAHLQRLLFTYLTLQGQAGLRIVDAGLPGIPGSNGWALAPSYTVDGHSLLLLNPHLPWSDLFVWIEAQLCAPDYDLYGITPVGVPVLTLAFDERHGWTHTVNTFDGWDAYLLTPAGDGYRFDGVERPFETSRETIAVREQDGSVRHEELTIRRSVHGPVLSAIDGRPVAVRSVGLEHSPVPHALAQWWDMGRARSFAEFEEALRRMQLPMFTIIYADREGQVLSQYAGLVPVRPAGDWDDWAGLVPGDSSATLWTEVHPFDDLPRVVDPPGGWVQNSNSPPWFTTLPPRLDPDDYPPYLAPRGLNPREQSALRMLSGHGPFTLDDLISASGSTEAELAHHVLDDLLAAAVDSEDSLVHRAAEVLAAWDRHVDAESRGAVLFGFWLEAVVQATPIFPEIFAVPWDAGSPLETPRGLADLAGAVAALRAAADRLTNLGLPLDVPWGQPFSLRRGDVDLPANGARDPVGSFRTTWYLPDADGRLASMGGTTFLAAVEFAEPSRAFTLLTYGNATQPGSPHIGDQLPLFARKELRPVWRERGQIEANLEARDVLK